jgi:hypothetical protein
MLLYHVTPAENLPRILAEGLIPQVGPRAHQAAEPIPVIYLFASPTEAEEGVINWLGDELPEGPLILLEVALPAGIPYRRVAFEIQVFGTIPPGDLRVLARW